MVLAARSGDIARQALSTPDDPTRAIEQGMQLIAEDLGETPAEIVSNSDLCINGTTVGLNALIQHKGGKTGLICTAGHEDLIEIRLGHKEDGYRYDPEYPAAVMLVPRYLRKGVRERVISNGSVKTPLQEDDVRAACRFFIEEGVEAVAISFLWSVLNSSHERRAAEIVREMMPRVALTVGSDLYPQVREYTRTSTAVVNAYLAPILSRYVAAVDEYFRRLGAKYPVRYFQSNGGLGLGQAISERSVYAIILHALALAGRLVRSGAVQEEERHYHRHGRHVFRHHADAERRHQYQQEHRHAEVSDRHSDDLGRELAPAAARSAGSTPWAYCKSVPRARARGRVPPVMARAGTQPTVTDANLVLGYLNPKGLLGGRLPLDLEKARKAIKTLAHPLGISVERAGYGMFTIVNSNMVNGIRRVSVERGYDPRDFVLVGAGGATAAHITFLAGEMGIDTIILPKLASGLCAFGQIISDVKYNYMATSPLRLEGAAYATINRLFEQIEAQGVKHLLADGFAKSAIHIERSLDMRYVGQVHE